MTDKQSWSGRVVSVQPRIRLHRSFDQRWHSYLGFVLRIAGSLGEGAGEFTVGIGKTAQAKHGFQVGAVAQGVSAPVADPRTEPVEHYKTSKLKVVRLETRPAGEPPWQGVAPPLETYQKRGHRRLAARTYTSSCSTCVWAARMAVEIILDQWNSGPKRYRTETFCYGPKSCLLYRPGPCRKVRGRRGMTYEEPDWVDDDATSHRGEDE